ncbi:hypothetical protein EDF36_2528 [Rathayibacter sp. PhB152]|uniref:hypothetical protein n=1 Tax=Rathayibacter sp. PhB152 TaxID=2485190 RepID=UPI000F4C0BBE|nr:hypothetical protein [Rathayibacter sp. PhB152]ROQ59069.1 hypothetical protein EDF36_2528 [Rathayibacter sp. PhB152]
MASAEFTKRSAEAIVLYPAVDYRAEVAIRAIAPGYPRLSRSQHPLILGTAEGLEFWDDRRQAEPGAVLPWSRVVAMNGPGPTSRLGGLRIRVRHGERALTVEIPLRPGGVCDQHLPAITVSVLANRLRLLASAVGMAEDVAEVRPTTVRLLPGTDSTAYAVRAGWVSLAGTACAVLFLLLVSLLPPEALRTPSVGVPVYGLLAAFIVSVVAALVLGRYGTVRLEEETSAGYRITGSPWPVGIPLVDRRTGDVVPAPEGTAPPGTV